MRQSKDRSSPPEVFLGKGFLEICSKFTVEHPCLNLFKGIKKNWTGSRNFEICFCVIFRCFDQIFLEWRLDTRSQPIFQRRINFVSTLWINIEITLIQRWKWNKIRRRIFNIAQRWYNVSARRWNNVETTLHNVETTLHNVGTTLIQHCFNLVDVS